MDLSFTRFDRANDADFPALLAGVSARQAASPTAAMQARLTPVPRLPSQFAPEDGRFSATTARALAQWKEE